MVCLFKRIWTLGRLLLFVVGFKGPLLPCFALWVFLHRL